MLQEIELNWGDLPQISIELPQYLENKMVTC